MTEEEYIKILSQYVQWLEEELGSIVCSEFCGDRHKACKAIDKSMKNKQAELGVILGPLTDKIILIAGGK